MRFCGHHLWHGSSIHTLYLYVGKIKRCYCNGILRAYIILLYRRQVGPHTILVCRKIRADVVVMEF